MSAARLAAVALWLLAGLASAAAAEDPKRELEQIHEAIERSRDRLVDFEERTEGLLDTLEEVDREAVRLSRQVEEARERARLAEAQRTRLEGRSAELGQRQATTRAAMRARSISLYKAGEAGPLRVLFSAQSLPEMLARTRGLAFLLEHDQRLLRRFRSESAQLGEALAASRQAAWEHEQALAELDSRSGRLEVERTTKRELLARVRADRKKEKAALGELESAAQSLADRLEQLGRSRPGSRGKAGAFVALRGRLAPPVDAPVKHGFGRVVDREFRTLTFRKGLDFGAPNGAPVRAVAGGEVRFAGWFRGYGNMVIVDHGDQYFTVSAHLAELARGVGDAVRAGDLIGTVGETGSLAGPLLYFEIRRGSEPLDPGEWLQGLAAR